MFDIHRIARAIDSEKIGGPSSTEERNTKAQEDVAWWAPGLFWLALCELVIIVYGVVMVRNTLREARREFAASHRPKIIVRRLRLSRFFEPFNEHTAPLQVEITASNRGDVPAQITGISATAFRRHKTTKQWPGGEVSFTGVPLLKPLPSLQPGESATISLQGQRGVQDGRNMPVINPARVLGNPDWDEVIIGELHYRGGDGVLRTTGFLRKFDVPSRGFIPLNDPGYEYDD